MKNQPFDILSINETRLDKSIPDSLIHLPGYSLSRFDRIETVAVYALTFVVP